MAKFQRDDRDDERDESHRSAKSGGNTAIVVALAVFGGVVLLTCAGGVAAMFLFTARIEERQMAREEAAVLETQKIDEAMAADEMEEVRAFREKVAHYLAESRAAAKVMAGNPSVEDAKKAARQINELHAGLPDVPPEVDRTGKVSARLGNIRGSMALAAENVRLRAGFAELGDEKEVQVSKDRLAKFLGEVNAAADEVEVMVKP